MFSCEFCAVSKNTFSYRHLRWLLLYSVRRAHLCIVDIVHFKFWYHPWFYWKFTRIIIYIYKDSRPQLFSKIPPISKNFRKFPETYPRQSFVLSKVANLQFETLLKARSTASIFVGISRNFHNSILQQSTYDDVALHIFTAYQMNLRRFKNFL